MRQHLFALVEDTGVICSWKSYAMRRPCCASCPRSWRMARSLRDLRSAEISAAEGMTCPAMLYTYCCNRPLRRDRQKTPVPLVCLAPHCPRVGGHVRTGYRWGWWLRHAALSYEIGRQVDGTVEADDLSHTAGHTGQAKQGGKKASLCFSQTQRLHDLGIGLCMKRDACGLQIAVESTPVEHLPQLLPCPGPRR
jgi:hypothetical protein